MKSALTLVLAVALCACVNEDDGESSLSGPIRVGVLPDQSLSGLSARYDPLMDYLEEATGLDFELSIPSDYQELLADFEAGRLQLANFGGVTFTQIELRSDAEPLIMRDVDLKFMSCYLVKASDARRSVVEFEGESFSFGPELSTSGHLMPRHFLTANGVKPERFFGSVRHASGHDQTAAWVDEGTVVIGVANCEIVRSMFEDGRLSVNRLRILETTPPYANYVWAVPKSLDPALKIRLRDAFLALDVTDPVHLKLLKAQGANGYLPAGRDDFEDIREAARAVGLIDPEPSG